MHFLHWSVRIYHLTNEELYVSRTCLKDFVFWTLANCSGNTCHCKNSSLWFETNVDKWMNLYPWILCSCKTLIFCFQNQHVGFIDAQEECHTCFYLDSRATRWVKGLVFVPPWQQASSLPECPQATLSHQLCVLFGLNPTLRSLLWRHGQRSYELLCRDFVPYHTTTQHLQHKGFTKDHRVEFWVLFNTFLIFLPLKLYHMLINFAYAAACLMRLLISCLSPLCDLNNWDLLNTSCCKQEGICFILLWTAGFI